MATSLSESEFTRMQTQLLGLRETNYELDDKCKKHEKELASLREQMSTLEKENQKANQVPSIFTAIGRSKKAKEFELLIHENESMQMKLQGQEEDFRLQNEALIRELGQLVALNENLEKELSALKKEPGFPAKDADSANLGLHDDLRRLQAQNAALQNSLTTSQKEHEDDCNRLRKMVSRSESRDTTDGCTDSNRAANDEQNNGHKSKGEEAESSEMIDSSNKYIMRDEESFKRINELRLNVDTEKEENRLLKEHVQQTESKQKEETKTLQNEIERLNEKLRKKQESLLQLQEDKDRLFCELTEKVRDIQTVKDNEITSLRQQTNKFQQELNSTKKDYEDELNQSKSCVGELEELLSGLQNKIDNASHESNEKMAEQLSQYEKETEELKNRTQELNNRIDDLNTQLQECQKAQATAMDQLLAVQSDRDNQILALQEVNRLAEKRKSILDQLAVKYQEETDRNREQMRSATSAHDSKIGELSNEVDLLKGKLIEMNDIKNQLDQLRPQITSLEGAKSWLERRLNETEENSKQASDRYESQIGALKADQESAIRTLTEENSNEKQVMLTQIADVQKEKDELIERIQKLEQEIKDQVDDKVLHEKKGATMLKDLKRQLQTERKRADKLQEKLQEFLSDSRSRQSVEELFRPSEERQNKFGDNSSLSSWSPSGLGRDSSFGQSPDEELGQQVNLRQENDDLVKRLADVQQQKWILEEKVSHLESSNAAMVDDLLNKTAVIEHYSMDSRAGTVVTSPSSDKITLKRVVDFVIDKGDENMRDMNRKLQRIIEETLTKNMHLEQSLEQMSKELEEMRRGNCNSSCNPPSGVNASSARSEKN